MNSHMRRMIHRGAFRPRHGLVDEYRYEVDRHRDRVVRRRGTRNSTLRLRPCVSVPCPPWENVTLTVLPWNGG